MKEYEPLLECLSEKMVVARHAGRRIGSSGSVGESVTTENLERQSGKAMCVTCGQNW